MLLRLGSYCLRLPPFNEHSARITGLQAESVHLLLLYSFGKLLSLRSFRFLSNEAEVLRNLQLR
jgi:hypothetical protein